MSRIVTTELGRFNLVDMGGGTLAALLECPGCGEWLSLAPEQMNGTVSADHAANGCVGGYHETHNYDATLKAVLVAARLTESDPFDVGDVA